MVYICRHHGGGFLLLSSEWVFTWDLNKNSSNFRITELPFCSEVAKDIGQQMESLFGQVVSLGANVPSG